MNQYRKERVCDTCGVPPQKLAKGNYPWVWKHRRSCFKHPENQAKMMEAEREAARV